MKQGFVCIGDEIRDRKSEMILNFAKLFDYEKRHKLIKNTKEFVDAVNKLPSKSVIIYDEANIIP